VRRSGGEGKSPVAPGRKSTEEQKCFKGGFVLASGKIRGKRREKEFTGREREKGRERKEKNEKKERKGGERKTLTLESVRVFLRSNSYGHLRNHLILGLIS
jgi:hypothetical protein